MVTALPEVEQLRVSLFLIMEFKDDNTVNRWFQQINLSVDMINHVGIWIKRHSDRNPESTNQIRILGLMLWSEPYGENMLKSHSFHYFLWY